MSELVIVFAVCVGSLLLAGFQARGLLEHLAGHHELERMLAAVQRACADFLWQETKLVSLLVAIVGFSILCPLALWGSGVNGTLESLVWGGVGLGCGAASSVAVAHLARWAAARASRNALEAVRHDRELATLAAFRGASVLAITAEAASLLLTSCLFVSRYFYLTAVDRLDADAALFLAGRSLPAAALGALCAATVFQVGGNSLHTAAGVAATTARARHDHIAKDEEHNPLLVAELVGDYVGGVVSRSTDAFAALLLANAGLIMVAGLVARDNAALGLGALALVGLPLVARALGLFATSITLGSLRFEARFGLPFIFAAASGCHAILLLTGILGAAVWLLGDALYSTYVGAAALGVLASVLSATVLFAGDRSHRSLASGPALARPENSVARALGLGLQRTWSLLLIVGACLGAAWLLGSRAQLTHGGAYALVVAVASLLGNGAFHLCSALFAAISESVLRVSELRRARFDESARERAREIDHAGLAIGHFGHTQSILGASTAALFISVMLPLLRAQNASAKAALLAPLNFAHPVVILGGALGAGSLLFHVGGMLKTSSRTASALDRDVFKRVEAAGERGHPMTAALPSYKDSVQLAMGGATEALLPLALTALLTPFLVGASLRLFYGAAGGAMAAQSLMAFGTIAALTGCCAALASQGTLVALAHPRRAAEEPGVSISHAHSARDFMGRCIGPAALLGLKATAVSALAAVPLSF